MRPRRRVTELIEGLQVHKAKNDLNAALKCLKKADEVSPNNPDVQKEVATVTKLIQRQKVTERELAKRMFGEQKSAAREERKKDTRNKVSRRRGWSEVTGNFVAAVGVERDVGGELRDRVGRRGGLQVEICISGIRYRGLKGIYVKLVVSVLVFVSFFYVNC
jgi:hypothetical protein